MIGISVVHDERGTCVRMPLSLIGLTAGWLVAVALLCWNTLGGPDVAGRWGLLAGLGATAWTIVYEIERHSAVVVRAFELGREVGPDGSVHRLPGP